jgi:hypothetical protein
LEAEVGRAKDRGTATAEVYVPLNDGRALAPIPKRSTSPRVTSTL